MNNKLSPLGPILARCRAVVEQGAIPPEAALELAGEYQRAIAAINEKLSLCAQFLKAGHRWAAFGLAETEPDLFKLPEQWTPSQHGMFLTRMGFPLEEPYLDLPSLQRLDEERRHDSKQKVLPLLREYRRQSMSHAPLCDRLRTVRRLLEHHPDNAAWLADAQAICQRAGAELRDKVVAVGTEGSEDAVAEMLADVALASRWFKEAREWRDKLHERRQGLAVAEQQRAAEERDAETISRLKRALSRFDEPTWHEAPTEHLQAWNDQLLALRADLPAEKLDQVITGKYQNQLSALRDEIQIRHQLAEARGRLEKWEHAADEQLRRFAADLEAFPDTIAWADLIQREPALDTRRQALMVRSRAAQASAEQQVQSAWIRTGWMVAAGLILMVGVALWGFQWWNYEQSVAHVTTEVRAQLDAANYLGAKADLDAFLQHTPQAATRLSPLAQEVDKALGSEEERRQRFGAVMARLEGQAWNQVAPQDLTQAEQWALGDAERERVAAVRRRMKTEETQAEQARTDQIATRLAAIKTELDTAQQSLAQEQECGTDLRSRREELSRISGYTQLDARVAAQVTALLGTLDGLDRQVGTLAAKQQALLRITQSVGDTERFASELDRYARDYTDSRGADFKTVLAEQAVWKGMTPSLAAAARWDDMLQRRDVSQSTVLQMDLKELQTKWPACPVSSRFQTPLAALEKLSAQVRDVESPPLSRIVRFLDGPEKFVVRKGEKCYYLVSKLDPGRSTAMKVQVKYLLGQEAEDLAEIPLERELASNAQVAARSALLNKLYVELVPKLRTLSWEAWFLDMIETAHRDPALDPLAKITLISLTLDAAAEGSLAFAQEDSVTQLRSDLVSGMDVTANWIDPDNPRGQEMRTRAMAKLKQFDGALRGLRGKVFAKMAQLWQPLGLRIGWVGLLTKGPDGVWTCRLKSTLQTDGSLAVIKAGAPDQPGTFVRVGEIKAGQPNIFLSAPEALIEGRPVYFNPTKL